VAQITCTPRSLARSAPALGDPQRAWVLCRKGGALLTEPLASRFPCQQLPGSCSALRSAMSPFETLPKKPTFAKRLRVTSWPHES
jgi:hypothetical protein